MILNLCLATLLRSLRGPLLVGGLALVSSNTAFIIAGGQNGGHQRRGQAIRQVDLRRCRGMLEAASASLSG